MPKVLIVQDSRLISVMLTRRIREDLGHQVIRANTLARAMEILDRDPDFLVALIGLSLPGAPEGQAVDAVIARGVPAIVFTGEFRAEMRESFWGKGIVDYVPKESMESLEYLVALIKRIRKNPGVKVLVVDDSKTSRSLLARLLRTHRYQVLEAVNGKAALEVLQGHADVRLAIVDCIMPGMDGFELTRHIRRRHGKDELAVIGVSAQEGRDFSAQFIKSGANDFLHKPFLTEEFYTRVTQNVELLERIAEIQDLANKDYLTKVYNRRHFFTAGRQMWAGRERGNLEHLALAMLDIDHFKRVNDTFGHDAGDAVLKHMSDFLAARFRETDIVARVGGEEFCVLAVNMGPAAAREAFEGVRRGIEGSVVRYGDAAISYAVSIGVCCRPMGSLEQMVTQADQLLYESKHGGRNRMTFLE